MEREQLDQLLVGPPRPEGVLPDDALERMSLPELEDWAGAAGDTALQQGPQEVERKIDTFKRILHRNDARAIKSYNAWRAVKLLQGRRKLGQAWLVRTAAVWMMRPAH
jgi:hypothetical protein